ncbi:MAG: CocE/NonD family hydrolase [Gemmatimonadales bacterium]
MRRLLLATAAVTLFVVPTAVAQRNQPDQAELRARRNAIEHELQQAAVVERKLMVPMRDGLRMAADVYRPKDASKKYPTIFVRTPYNFNFWDVRLGAPRDMSRILDAVKRGYAWVDMNERGHFFSEGNYDILGAPVSDGTDAIDWISSRGWSNGKVGTLGCSSTAEWQMAVAAQGAPGYAAMIPQGFGAGVGRVGPYFEQGNWYRGGAVQMLFIAWLYGEQNQLRPMFPRDLSREDLIKASMMFDLAPQMPPVDWSQALRHLPSMDIIDAVNGPKGIFADSMPVPTGGAMMQRTPNDPAWYRGGLFHDDMVINVPGLWFMSWYDVSVGPNLATYNHVRKTARAGIADQQYAVIAPTLHCAYTRATENTVVGERSMGDARLDYDALVFGWFDRFLKGENNRLLDTLPKVRYFTMGSNQWQATDTWPPVGAGPLTYYLSSGGNANSRNGDGVLTEKAPSADRPDGFSYDPMSPVPSYGGNVCCTGNAVTGGALDQQKMEERDDILVYSTEPLKEGMEVSGPIDVTLYVSSDAKDTDFTVKVIDVYPDGRAYNLDETIQRVRYREGYDKPETRMEPGKIYKVALQPMTTSNYFAPGHRIRIEVSSSNFPRFDRNMNTGGKNFDEATGVVARNQIHHSRKYPSSITVSVVRKPAAD